MEACSSSSSLNSTTKSPFRTIPKIRICASVSQEDLQTKRCQLSENQQNLSVEGKNYSRGVFDHVFWPNSSQDDISHAFLHDTIKSVVLQGNDATILSMGSKSAGKDERLYGGNIGGSTSRNGLVQIAITQLMTLLEEMRSDEERVQVRMSAIMISQHDSTIFELLSPFNPDPRHRIVRFVDDSRTGVYIDNESEIRVESIDQALFYLNTAVDHRLIQDEVTHRTCHVFISLSVYSHNLSESEKSGGRRRLCFLDMGIGDRNSIDKGITMPGLGSILLALVQRNKHVPLRETTTCQLIRCALSSSRFTTFLFSFGSRNDDNENIAHLACKIARTRLKNAFGSSTSTLKNKKHLNNNNSSEASSSDTTSRNRRDLESGSEFSAAETVIYLGPSTSSVPSTPTRALHRTSRTNSQTNILLAGSGDLTKPLSIETKASPTHSIPPMLKGHTPFFSTSLKLYDELCSPPGTSKTSPNAFGGVSLEERDDFGIMIAEAPKTPSSIASSKQKKYNLDDGKRKQIMKWMEGSESPPVLYTTPCYDQNWEETGGILSHPLEDIIEQEEESMKTSSCSKKDHPLRILSRQNLAEEKKEGSSDETELELVMAASLSSMKSHDILAKLEALRNTASGVSLNTTSDENASEMAVYRRASQLEEYAMLRVKEIEENKSKGKNKKKLGALNCCQIQSMVSSGSTVVDWSQIEKKKEQEKCAQEEEQRKEALRERRARLKITELEIKRERSLIDKELDDKRGLANSIARQLQHFSLSPCRSGPKHLRSSSSSTQHHRIDPPMCSLPSTPTMSHRKISEQKRSMQSSNNSLPRHHSRRKSSADKLPPTAERKSSKDRRTRTNSNNSKDDELLWRSPYSHMTSPKTYGGPGTSSSGRGSSAPGSDFEHNATGSSIVPGGTERRSKRQSYSASSGYESASNDYHCYTKSSIFDKVKNANEERMNFARQADQIRHRQRQLKKELEEAKRAIGQVDDVRVVNDHQNLNGLSRTTLIDTLLQENRILEKRLVACRNHSMLVTTFI